MSPFNRPVSDSVYLCLYLYSNIYPSLDSLRDGYSLYFNTLTNTRIVTSQLTTKKRSDPRYQIRVEINDFQITTIIPALFPVGRISLSFLILWKPFLILFKTLFSAFRRFRKTDFSPCVAARKMFFLRFWSGKTFRRDWISVYELCGCFNVCKFE